MGNILFQQARKAVEEAEMEIQSSGNNLQEKLSIAKNNLSSAYANSTIAEKRQLQELQQRIEQLEQQ